MDQGSTSPKNTAHGRSSRRKCQFRQALLESLAAECHNRTVTPHTDTIIEAETLAVEESTSVGRQETEVSLLDLAVLLVRYKRFIARFVVGGAVLAVLVALILPVRYEAKVTLLPPSQGSSSMGSALLGQLGNLGSLTALAGGFGIKNPTDMYVSLLTSRTVEDAMIQKFGLMDEYREKRISDARKHFERVTSVVAGSKDGLIRSTLEDGDPKRAADLANG